jgi:rhodanese-related sulfurtransferase
MPVSSDLLISLDPIAALSPGRVDELATICTVETVSQGLNPFRMNVVQNEQLLYLLKGELRVSYCDGSSETWHGGNENTRHAVVADKGPLQEALAVTDVQILRIDADLLDIMLTWDQLASYEKSGRTAAKQRRSLGQWMESPSVFSTESLKSGIFSALPAENVEQMFERMERIPVKAGDVIVRQGDVGDYYYLIENGVAEVTRASHGEAPTVVVARINAGGAFGEEALVSGNTRNATVTMAANGVLLRLGKNDFRELLQKPLLYEVNKEEAMRKIQAGAKLLDVRTEAEYKLKHLPGALNVPLHEIRNAMLGMVKTKEYLIYCQSGRRAAAATFIMAQQGFNAMAISFS